MYTPNYNTSSRNAGRISIYKQILLRCIPKPNILTIIEVIIITHLELRIHIKSSLINNNAGTTVFYGRLEQTEMINPTQIAQSNVYLLISSGDCYLFPVPATNFVVGIS